MADSIVDTIAQFISPSLVSRVASAYGESQPAVTQGFSAVIPVLVGMVTNRAHTPEFMSQVFALAKNPENDPTVFDDPTRLLAHLTSPARDGGPFSRFETLLFGSNRSRFVDTLANYAGLRTSTASSILAAAVPLVLGYFGRMIRYGNLDSEALANRLLSGPRSVSRTIPLAFSSLMSDTAVTGARAMAAAHHESRAASVMATRARSLWPWAAAAAVVAVLGSLFYTGLHPVPRQTARVAVDQTQRAIDRTHRAIDQTQRAVGTAGSYLTRKLPNGVDLSVPAMGSEAKLLNYISSAAPVSTDAWIEFDRIGFNTDSASLTPESREQLSGIASIMKAYPGVHLKIGGYTDNTGDAAGNVKLSHERATSVMDQLISMGVPSQRLEAEGYGSAHPVATNSTDEGREKNRRVAFRVTAR